MLLKLMQKAVWTRSFDTSVSFYIQEFVTITSRNINNFMIIDCLHIENCQSVSRVANY